MYFLDATLNEIALQNQDKLTNIIFENEKNLRLNSREYEYIILSDILSSSANRYKIMKTIYKALENSANIIILDKKSNNSLEEIKLLLDKTSFVAINDIELFEKYYLITAKKLHIWGSGL